MRRAVALVALGAALLGISVTAPAKTRTPAENPRAKLRTVELNGTIAVDGTPSAEKPVTFTARLIADARGVPLLRGGKAVIRDGRIYVNTFGTVISGCLFESSLQLAGAYSDGSRAAAQSRGDVLRIRAQRSVTLDVDVIVDASLRGLVGPDCATPKRDELGTLQLRGTLARGALAPVSLSASTPVTLVDGRRTTMRVAATATIRRYQRPLCVNCAAGGAPTS